jgi:hypothetical protein
MDKKESEQYTLSMKSVPVPPKPKIAEPSEYHFHEKPARELLERVYELGTKKVSEDWFFDRMSEYEYSDAEKANLLFLTIVLTPQVVGDQLYLDLRNKLRTEGFSEKGHYLNLLENGTPGLKQQKKAYKSLVDTLFEPIEKGGWAGDVRNFFDNVEDRHEVIVKLSELPGIREKVGNLIVLDLLHYDLIDDRFRSSEDIELPVDLNTCKICIRTGVVTSDSDSFYAERLRNSVRQGFSSLLDEFHKENYPDLKKDEIVNTFHRAFFWLGSTLCNNRKTKCNCSIFDICNTQIEYSDERGAYTIVSVDNTKQCFLEIDD